MASEGFGMWKNCIDVFVPLHLFLVFLLSGLSFHLLHLDGVGFPSPHVQFVVPHAQRQDSLVDPQARRVEDEILNTRASR